MSPSARWAVALSLPILAASIALARGKKAAEAEAKPVVDAPDPAPAVAPPPAPRLFAAAMPIEIDLLPPGLATLSAQTCNACHWSAHDTWTQSAHAHAWSSPTYQAALATAGNSTACVSCHLPLAVQHESLASGYLDGDLTRPRLSPNPAFDASLMSEGVTCAACHVREGTVLGTQDSSNSPHPITVSDELSGSAFCATCHQLTWPEADRPFYDTFGEWEASGYSKAGVDCQDCHMAPQGGTAQPGNASIGPAHSSPTTVARALTTMVSIPSSAIPRGVPVSIVVRVTNTGAGHSVPTGSPFKSWTIETVLLDDQGKALAPAHQHRLVRTVDSTPPWRTLADERLAAGGRREWVASLTPNAKGRAGVGTLVVRAVRPGESVDLRRIPVRVQ